MSASQTHNGSWLANPSARLLQNLSNSPARRSSKPEDDLLKLNIAGVQFFVPGNRRRFQLAGI
jgi:hypothetical protein